MKIDRPGDIICPVLGGLEALGRTNLERISEIIGDAKAKQIMDGKLAVRDLPEAQKKQLRAQGLIDANDRIPGLVADSKGFVTYDQIETAFKNDLKTSSPFAFAGMSAAPAGDHSLAYAVVKGPEVLLRRLTGTLDQMRMNLWELPHGGAKHNYDSLILTETGKYSEERLQEILQFAEVRNGTKVMTRASFEKAIHARLERDAGRPGSAAEGISLALGEAHAMSALKPEGWDEAELRAFYRDKKFPADLQDRQPVTVANLMFHLLPGIVKELGPTIGADVRRLNQALQGALGSWATWGGKSMRGAELSSGQGSLSDTRANAANGLGTADVAGQKKAGGVCPFLSGQMSSVPGPEQLAETHTKAITDQRS